MILTWIERLMTGEPTSKTVKSSQKNVKENKLPKATKEGKNKRKQN